MPRQLSTFTPQRRGTLAEKCAFLSGIAFILVGSILTLDNLSNYLKSTFLMYSFSIIVSEILYRFCLILEETNHIQSLYNNNYRLLFSNTFTFSFRFILWCLITFTICTSESVLELSLNYGITSTVCSLIGIILLSKTIKLDYGPIYEAVHLERLGGLGYGSSNAYSYFHGFLQIVLPNNGSDQKGIKELMQDFESKENIKFAYHKLLVLIPVSLFCPPNLQDHGRKVELVKSLGEIHLSRGGVLNRVYKNTVYKINSYDENGITKRTYVCAEYATPLRTMHDIMRNNNPHADLYERHRLELVNQFYITLKEILDKSPECKDCCDLIVFNDKNAENNYEDVGDIILEHLRKMRAI